MHYFQFYYNVILIKDNKKIISAFNESVLVLNAKMIEIPLLFEYNSLKSKIMIKK